MCEGKNSRCYTASMPRPLAPLQIQLPLSERGSTAALTGTLVPTSLSGEPFPPGTPGYYVLRLNQQALAPIGTIPDSASKISRDTGLNVPTVYRILHGQNPISAELAATLAHTYRVPLSQLCELDIIPPTVSKSGTKKDTPESGTKNRRSLNTMGLLYIQERAVRKRAATARRVVANGSRSPETLRFVPEVSQPHGLNPTMQWATATVNTLKGDHGIPAIPPSLFDHMSSPLTVPGQPEAFQLIAAREYRELLITTKPTDYLFDTLGIEELRTPLSRDSRTQRAHKIGMNNGAPEFIAGWLLDHPRVPIQSRDYLPQLTNKRMVAESPFLTPESDRIDPTYSYMTAQKLMGIPGHPYLDPAILARATEKHHQLDWDAVCDIRRGEIYDCLSTGGWGSVPAIDFNTEKPEAIASVENFLNRHDRLRPLLGIAAATQDAAPAKVKKPKRKGKKRPNY